MSCPVERLQIDIGHTTYLDIVKSQCPLNMSYTCGLLKEGLAQIRCTLIHAYPQISSPARRRELDKDVAHILYTLAKFIEGGPRTTDRYRVVSFRETLHQVIHITVPFFSV